MPSGEVDSDVDMDGSFCEYDRHGYTDEDERVRQAFFRACPTLETLCIPKWDLYSHWGEYLMVRDSRARVKRINALPSTFWVRQAPKDRNGNFMTGIPNAWRKNYDDDDGDRKYAEAADLQDKKARPWAYDSDELDEDDGGDGDEDENEDEDEDEEMSESDSED